VNRPDTHITTTPTAYSFLAQVALLCLLPLLPFIVAYVLLDPFKVLREHEDYFSDGIGKNKGMVSLRAFEAGNPRYHYDSFILGSSVSCHYPVAEWQKYLPQGAVPFHMDSSDQTIRCMRLYVEYLDTRADAINNVLIVLSPFILGLDPDALPQACAIPAPLLSSPIDKALFHYDYFRLFATEGFLSAYVPWLMTGNKNDTVTGGQRVFEPQPIAYNPATNEESIPSWDALISSNPEAYYARHHIETPPPQAGYKVAPRLLSDTDKEDLRAVASILRRHNANVKVIMAPELSLTVPCAADQAFFADLFGADYVDLTCEFRAELQERTNYYDNIHYRPPLAVKFMRRAYR